MSESTAMVHASSRFGLGGRPDTPISGNPADWLTRQLAGGDATPGPSLRACLALIPPFVQSTAGSTAKAQAMAAISSMFRTEVQAYMLQAVVTATPFRERLVRFWANHFAIMADTVEAAAVAGTFVRDAIRPHVTGNFSDMLQAVVTHPAMLYSLNAEDSSGPACQVSLKQIKAHKSGLNLNENLGRESLELYTVGIGAGYSQADVDAMATLLTGFRVNVNTTPFGFVYLPSYAQPGNSTLLGTTYANTLPGCMGALHMLATQPATYQHLATKLAVHFISDTPSAGDIATIEKALAASGGNLGAAAASVIGLASAWVPLTKLRTPQDYIIALMRASNSASTTTINTGSLAASLGEPVWQPPFPNGWSDFAVDWTGPAGLGLRSGMAQYLALQSGVPSPDLLASLLGPLLSDSTRSVIGQAQLPYAVATLLFNSPEFQRR